MRTEILKILRTAEGAVSGQQLCDGLGKSRTAVWKIINQLKEEGYEIEAVQNKGYRLIACPDVVTKEEIESIMQTDYIGRTVYHFRETGSTNIAARKLADEGAPNGALVVAEKQISGKGRRGKDWESPEGTGIFMTLVLKPDIHPSQASMITLLMAMAVTRGIRDITGLRAEIKWPNDVLLEKKKVCGILTEMSMEMDGIHHVVIGAGINVNTESFPDELVDKAASVRQICGKHIKRADLIAAVMEAFEHYYEQFLKRRDLTLLREEYERHLVNLGKEVAVIGPDKTERGKALGINERGELLVQADDGEVRCIYAGEVSVRGVYGYV